MSALQQKQIKKRKKTNIIRKPTLVQPEVSRYVSKVFV